MHEEFEGNTDKWVMLCSVAIRTPKWQVHKASQCGSKQQQRSHYHEITLLLLVHSTYIWVLFFAHIPFVVNRTFNATPTERLQQQTIVTMFIWEWEQLVCDSFVTDHIHLRLLELSWLSWDPFIWGHNHVRLVHLRKYIIKMWFTVNQISFTLTWRKMNGISNECGLDWTWSHIKRSQMKVSYECALKWTSLKRTWSQMLVFSNEVVSNKVVSNE